MLLLSAIIGLGAAAFLLTAGYMLGATRGAQARDSLRERQLASAQELARMREQDSRQGHEHDESLRTTIEQVLAPLVQRERVSIELSRLEGGTGQHGDLTNLLDQIAEKGNFSAVLLSDQEGWPIGASRSTKDVEKLGATCSLLQLVADRMGRDGAAAPLSLMIHDGANRLTLSRIFTLDDHRLVLTAVSAAGQMTSTALDPALVKIGAVLSSRGRSVS